MNQQMLFQTIFNGTNEASFNKKLLNDITAQFPYFGLAHYFTLKNSSFHETDFNTIAAKTNLFFSNPFYLQKKIEDKKTPESLIIEEQKKEIDTKEITTPYPSDPTIKFLKEDTNTNKIAEPEKTNTNPDNEELLFEPLYTSDYFASVGIKLSDVVLDNDKLGKQLKSFTSWLKTMKRIHPEKPFEGNVLVENTIQKQAEMSNKEEDILTEAMAEAFESQGKNIRAIEIYSKLSLMIPEKSAYFAHKIENLK